MESNKKLVEKEFTFTLEETLTKTLTAKVYVPEEDVNGSAWMGAAIEKVKEMYSNKEVVLTADDYNGSTLLSISDDITETEFFNLF